jgi:hypothetical protein
MWSSRRKSWKDDADPAPQRRAAVLAQRRGVAVEHADQAACRPQRQEQHAQQRSLAGAGWPGEELERMPVDTEAEVAQDLLAEPIAQADILESDHAVLRKGRPPQRPAKGRGGLIRPRPRT